VTDTKMISAVVCPPGTDGGYCDLNPQQTPERVCPYMRILEVEQRNLTKEEADAARKDPRCDAKYFNMRGGVVVDDGSALAILTGATGDDLARARATLQAGGIVVRDDSYIKNGKVSVTVINQTGKAPFDPATAPKVELPAYLLTTGIPGSSIISPAAVAAAGLSTQPVELVAATSRPPTQVEIDRALGQVRALETDMYVEDGPPIVVDVRIWILVAAAAAITLAAAGVGTGLAAADGRQDLSTLAAVGASPRLRRVLSLSQSAVIAGLGSILGALAGIGAAIAIVVSLNVSMETSWPGPTPMPIELPWLSLAISLVVVPLIAMLGAGSFTRSRLPVERRL
jgi:putative ABC transport system permease protein